MASGGQVLVVNDAIDVDRACDAIGAAWHTTIELRCPLKSAT
jgi:hypothetical protein